MSAAIKIRLTSLTKAELFRKFAIAFVLMSLVPIAVILYIMYILDMSALLEKEIPYFKLTIALVVLLSAVVFYFVRRSIISIGNFVARAHEIAEGKYSERVKVNTQDDVAELAESFNKITAELETKIAQLQESKDLLQDILQKIGTAVSSQRGIDNLLELVIQSLVKGMDASSGAILIFDETHKRFQTKVSYGMEDAVKFGKFDAAKGLMARVLSIKKAETASNISRNPAAYNEFHNKLAKDSILVMPLLYHNRVLGAVVVSDKIKGQFNNDDMVLINNVAAQAAIALMNFQLNEDAEQTYIETITALAIAVEAKDIYSRGHLDRVADYVEKLGNHIKLDQEVMRMLRSGAILHDVGKIGIRDEVLRKQGPLTPEEEDEMRRHVIIGVNIIKPIRKLSALCDIVRHHQEMYDGTGYPDGLKGEEIPLVARILKICDSYDAMTTNRSYRKALTKEEAKAELRRRSGTDFDPKLVEEFLKII